MSIHEPGSRRWAASVPHRHLVDAICREMDEYLSCFAELEFLQRRSVPDHPVLDERRITLTILISSYIEAVANLYLTFALPSAAFKAVDYESVHTKWTEVPARRLPSYSVTEKLSGDLASLVKSRNAIAHMKPEFSVGEQIIHTGNSGPLESITHDAIMCWSRLPLDLVNNVRCQDKSDAGNSLDMVSDAWEASTGWDDRLTYYREQYAQGRGKRLFPSI